jgi:hypothetical protein
MSSDVDSKSYLTSESAALPPRPPYDNPMSNECLPSQIQASIQQAGHEVEESLMARIKGGNLELADRRLELLASRTLTSPCLNSQQVKGLITFCLVISSGYSDSAISFIHSLILMLPDYGTKIQPIMDILFSKDGLLILQKSTIRTHLIFGSMKNRMSWTISGFGISTLTKHLYLNSFTKVGSASVARIDTFHAKEEFQFSVIYSSSNMSLSVPQCRLVANATDFDPGDPETIWNSTASHLSKKLLTRHYFQWPFDNFAFDDFAFDDFAFWVEIQQINSPRFWLPSPTAKELGLTSLHVVSGQGKSEFIRLLKGRNEEWGSLWAPPSCARIDHLFDRDHVWVVTQTMVSIETLALWAMHAMQAYKVYPGFWGRLLLTSSSKDGHLTTKMCYVLSPFFHWNVFSPCSSVN